MINKTRCDHMTLFAYVAVLCVVSLGGTTIANDVETSVTVSTSSPPPGVGFNEGGNDGLNWTSPDGNKSLKVTLNAPADHEIKCSNQTVISEGIAWECADWNQWAASHLYASALITPKDFFRPLFSGEIRGAGGGGPPPTWKAGVVQADIQADADNDSTTAQRPPATAEAERKQEEVAEQGGEGNPTGLIVSVNVNYDEGGTGAVTNRDEQKIGVVTNDPDLVQAKLVLKLPTEVVPDSKVKLTYDSAKLLVYKPSDLTTPIASGTQIDVSTFGTNNTLLIEGKAASSSSGGNSIQVTLTPKIGDVSKDKLIVTVVKINVDIYSGSGRAGATAIARTLAPETNHDVDALEDEEDIGTFTVANMNNTNGNYSGGSDVSDLTEDSVLANGSHGTDEVDLMQLRLHRPQPSDLPGHVKITVVSGTIKIWSAPTKVGDEIMGDALTFQVSDFGGNSYKDWWVEAREATALQGIKLKYEYRPKVDVAWLAPDVVTATGIWATQTNFQQWGYSNVRVTFTITPNSITSVPLQYGDAITSARPLFDVSRQVQASLYQWSADVPSDYDRDPEAIRIAGHALYPHFPENRVPVTHNEWANDDATDRDETDEPNVSGVMYSEDGPRLGTSYLGIMRANFKEFVRIRFDGTDPGDTPYANGGSRCSSYSRWYARDTVGLVTSPQGTGEGDIDFEREALHIQVVATTAMGKRHHAVCLGLDLSSGTGAGSQDVTVDVFDDDPGIDDEIDTNILEPVVGLRNAGNPTAIDCETQVGDHVAYTAVGYFVSASDGEICGPNGEATEDEAQLYHKIVVAGGGGPESPRKTVTGTEFSESAPMVPNPLTLGAVTTVTISGAYTESDSTGSGTQSVTLHLIDYDPVDDDTLANLTASATRRMEDEKTGAWVDAIRYGGILIPDTYGYIGAKDTGEIGGKDGWSGEGDPGDACELAYEVIIPWEEDPQSSPNVPRNAPTYTPPVAQFSATTIPVDGSITMTMDTVYAHSTGSTGGQSIKVEVYDSDPIDDDLLVTLWPYITRPANCFPGMLIGPVSTDTMLHNTDHEVTASGGSPSSGEQTAEIYYEIADEMESSNTDITAE